LGIGSQHAFGNLDHDGSLGALTGPFAGQALNPFESRAAAPPLLGAGMEPSAPPAVPTQPKARRNIPNFEADLSLRRS
jgi:putative transposase